MQSGQPFQPRHDSGNASNPGQQAAALLAGFLQPHGNRRDAETMERYMKGVAPFWGIKTEPRRVLLRTFWQAHGVLSPDAWNAFTEASFNLPQREAHYAAIEYLQGCKRAWLPEHLPLFEWLLTQKPWWDAVDTAATKLIGPLLLRYPALRDAAVERWLKSGQLWMLRTAVIFQLGHGKETDEDLLFEIIRQLSFHPDFFIRKGIGWALRQYARTAPLSVVRFVEENPLSPLSRREALRRL